MRNVTRPCDSATFRRMSRAPLWLVDHCACSQMTSPRAGRMNCCPDGVTAYSMSCLRYIKR